MSDAPFWNVRLQAGLSARVLHGAIAVISHLRYTLRYTLSLGSIPSEWPLRLLEVCYFHGAILRIDQGMVMQTHVFMTFMNIEKGSVVLVLPWAKPDICMLHLSYCWIQTHIICYKIKLPYQIELCIFIFVHQFSRRANHGQGNDLSYIMTNTSLFYTETSLCVTYNYRL